MTDPQRTELERLAQRLSRLENVIVSYMLKQRELAIIDMSHIEDELSMPRTKEKRERK